MGFIMNNLTVTLCYYFLILPCMIIGSHLFLLKDFITFNFKDINLIWFYRDMLKIIFVPPMDVCNKYTELKKELDRFANENTKHN